MRRLLLIVAIAAALCAKPGVALADCPDDFDQCEAQDLAHPDAAPSVDLNGEPIPYVDEVDAPPTGIALIAEDSN